VVLQWQSTLWQWQQRLALPDSGVWCCCGRAVAAVQGSCVVVVVLAVVVTIVAVAG